MPGVVGRIIGALATVAREVGRDLLAALRWLGRVLAVLFGRLSWSPPPWLRAVGGAIGRRFSAMGAWARARPRATTAIVVAVVALGAGGGYALHGYLGRPKPHEVTYRGTTPAATPLREDAVPDPLHISFSESVAPIGLVGQPVTKGIRMTPRIRGVWRWASDTELVFTPAEDWGVGQAYDVRFARSFVAPHVRLAEYDYRFSSAPFAAAIAEGQFYQDPRHPAERKVVATVRFTHPVEARDFEGRVHLRLKTDAGERPYRFTVEYDRFRGEAYIHSDPVAVPMEDEEMAITIDEGVRSSRGGDPFGQALEQKVRVPGRFNLLQVRGAELTVARNERNEMDQLLVVSLTAGVPPDRVDPAISACLLPTDRPAVEDRPAIRNYAWPSPVEIGPEILRQCTSVPIERAPSVSEDQETHVYRYHAQTRRHLYVKVRRGVESAGGYVLAREFDTVARVPDFPRELAILHEGAILSLTGEKRLSVVARNLEAVRFEIGRVLSTEINHVVSQTSGRLSSPSFEYGFGEDDVVERFEEVRTLERTEPGRAQYASFEFSNYLAAATPAMPRRGLFFLQAQSWDPARREATGLTDRRFVLVTDLGVLVKDNADLTHDVFVQSFRAGGPVPGARVRVLGRNGVPIAESTTDGDGHGAIPNLHDFTRERAPVVYLVETNDDLSFLPYDRYDRRLDFSRFDVGGATTQGGPNPMRAYLFSDRGLYRPGDTAHLAFIVKTPDWGPRLAGVPLEISVTDPRGVEVQRQRIALGASGLDSWQFQTEPNAPTGTYQAGVYVVRDNERANLLAGIPLRIEEFLPDPMRMTARLSEERREGWIRPTGLHARVKLMSLFGAAATARRVTGSITLSPVLPAFSSLPDYTFFDPAHENAQSFDERLSEATTDDNGEAQFELDLGRYGQATYALTFTARGYTAEGGRSVYASASAVVSPRPYLVGWKPDGDLHYVHRASDRAVEIIAVDPALRRVGASGLEAEVIERRFVSTLVRQPNDTYRYESVLRDVSLEKRRISIPAGGLRFALPTAQPGNFVIVVRDAGGADLGKIPYTVAGEANLARSLDRTAELQIALNRSDYAPGDDIELQIVAPYVGAGLITIERDHVYAHQWFRTTTNASVQHIRVPADLEGNGYVNVAFVRALDSDEIFMSPLSYGVVPFSVSREGRADHIRLDVPDRARPGEPLVIRYRTDHPGKIVVFAVDEGILQVARYDTPDPLGYFLRKRALEVRTGQILDLLLPEYSMVRRRSAGGGEEGEGAQALARNLNPFRRRQEAPVTYWSGIIDADATERELRYNVPDYFNGTVRVMAVAAAPEAVGAAERRSIVRGPFVLTPTAPTMVAPGDEFDVGLGLFNGAEGTGPSASIALDVETSAGLEIVGAAHRSVAAAEGREAQTSVRVRAKTVLGSARITFTASLGERRARRSWDLSVRPAVPFVTTMTAGSLQSSHADVPTLRRLYPEFRTLEVGASSVPLGLAGALARYVEQSPWGSSEEVASQAVPSIVLRSRPDFGYTPEKVEASLAKALRILRSRQNGDGAFGFWAANSHVSDFHTVYAMQVLTEARDRRIAVPREMMDHGLEYVRGILGRRPSSLADARLGAYAAYVLTRNGINASTEVEALAAAMRARLGTSWRKDLAGIYLAATWALLRQERPANELIDESRLGDDQASDYESFYDDSIRDAQLLYVLARHFPRRLENLRPADLRHLVRPLSSGSYNTLWSAYTILAFDAYATAVPTPGPAALHVVERLAAGGERAVALPGGLFPRGPFSEDAQSLRIESTSDAPVFWQVTQAGFDRVPPTQASTHRLEVFREFRDATGAISRTTLGSEIEVHVRARTLDSGQISNVAIVDLLPGGFEVVEERAVPQGQSEEPQPRAEEGSGGSGGHPQGEGEGEGEGDYRGQGEGEASRGEPPAAPLTPIAAAGTTWEPEYLDVREDRVVFFGTVGPTVVEFVYKIRATNKGTFGVPPLVGEALYDRTVQARGGAARIVVE